jgi:hypothetical protein
MIKPIALTFACALTLAPVTAFAAETAVMGGPAGTPPVRVSPGAAPSAAPPASAPRVGQLPHANAHPPALSRNPRDCIKTVCANSNGE